MQFVCKKAIIKKKIPHRENLKTHVDVSIKPASSSEVINHTLITRMQQAVDLHNTIQQTDMKRPAKSACYVQNFVFKNVESTV